MDPAHRTAVVVEDDDDIARLVAATLSQAGFTTHLAGSGEAGVDAVRRHDPLVTTLDVALPDIDGLEVARRIRSFSATYLVMLTARAEEIDTLLGLEAGADDYLTKPFRPRELRARVEAMLRRPRQLHLPGGAGPAAEVPGPPAAAPVRVGAAEGIYTHGALLLDARARLTYLDGELLHLTRSEFDLLAALVRAPDRVLTRSELVHCLWGEQPYLGLEVTEADSRSLEVHMANLRRKLADDPASPRFIETVRGVGYRLAVRRGQPVPR